MCLLFETKNKVQIDLLSNLIMKYPRQASVFGENNVRIGKNAKEIKFLRYISTLLTGPFNKSMHTHLKH